MSENEQPMIALSVGIPLGALWVDGQHPMEAAENLSLSENGIKIEVRPYLQASAVQPTDVILWVGAAFAAGFFGAMGASAWGFVKDAWPKIVPRIKEAMRKGGMRWGGCRFDETLPFEGGGIHIVVPDVPPDDMANLFPLLEEENLGQVIRLHSPAGKVQRVNLRFHGSPPRLEVVSIHFASEGK